MTVVIYLSIKTGAPLFEIQEINNKLRSLLNTNSLNRDSHFNRKLLNIGEEENNVLKHKPNNFILASIKNGASKITSVTPKEICKILSDIKHPKHHQLKAAKILVESKVPTKRLLFKEYYYTRNPIYIKARAFDNSSKFKKALLYAGGFGGGGSALAYGNSQTQTLPSPIREDHYVRGDQKMERSIIPESNKLSIKGKDNKEAYTYNISGSVK